MSCEVRGALWAEIDTEDHVWTIPATRAKAKREHRVPLCRCAAAPWRSSPRRGRSATAAVRWCSPTAPASRSTSKVLRRLLERLRVPAVPHGFRSSFRDWAAEETDHPREVIEAALAHVVQNKVEAAYARSDLFDRRRRLMDDWASALETR